MTIRHAGLATIAILTLAVAAHASGGFTASMDEANLATNLSQKVGLLQYCGFENWVGPIARDLHAFETRHLSRGRPLTSDMSMAVAFSTMAYASKAGGKQKLCAAVLQAKAQAVGGIAASWKKLQEAHAEAKTAGHPS